MRTRYQITENSSPYFLTCTIIEWLPVFTRQPYFDIIIDTLKYNRQKKGLKLFAYVILDNHLHLVAAGDRLDQTVKEFKSHTARAIIEMATSEDKTWLLNQLKYYKAKHKKKSHYQVWQEGFHPQLIQSEDMLHQKIDYIHDNPVNIGLVERAEDWLYSSARNYLNKVRNTRSRCARSLEQSRSFESKCVPKRELGNERKSSPKTILWNWPQKQMADPVFTNRPFSCSGKVW